MFDINHALQHVQTGSGFRLRALALAAACGLAVPAASAQTASDAERNTASSPILEEVVITARKKEESLQDVPISVQALSGEFISEHGVIDIQMLAPYTPNFNYATAIGANDLLIMRGIGSIGGGPQFEPSVGQVFDGYFISRSRLGRAAFLDLARVEVLKGPQGAIIGKNTSLGAINITPAKPTDEFEASVTAGYSWEDREGEGFTGYVSGPLSDAVRMRVAGEYRDHDGWMKNTSDLAPDDTAGANETASGRVIIQADLSDSLAAELLYQRVDTTIKGKPRDVIWCHPNTRARIEAGGVLCGRDQTTSAVAFGLDDYNALGKDRMDIETNVYGLRFDWDLANFTISSLTGYSDYDIVEYFDVDQSPQFVSIFGNEDDYSQVTQELRIAGDTETLNYLAGMFYMDNEVDFDQNLIAGPNPGSGAWRNRFANVHRKQFVNVQTETISAFGQVDWLFSELYTATLGLRWTSEEREGEYLQYPTVSYSDTRLPCGPGPQACTRLNPSDTFPSTLADKISGDKVSGNVSLQRFFENGMVYLSFARGTKSPGFAVTSAQTPDAFKFDGEETDSFEVGGKHEFLGNSLRLNWVLYYMLVDGLQISSLDPTLAVPVQNVVNADVDSKGAEAEITWAATDALTLSLALGYIDAAFDDHVGNCYNGQTADQGCMNGLQDMDGVPLPLNPEFSSVFGVDYIWYLGSGMDLKASFKWIHSTDYSTTITHHPESFQDDYDKLDLSLVLSGNHGDNAWKLALVGTNLTDEITYQFGEAPPMIAGIFGPNRSLNAFPEIGRVITAKFTYNWYQ